MALDFEDYVRESLARIEASVAATDRKLDTLDTKVGDLRERVARVEVKSAVVASIVAAIIASGLTIFHAVFPHP